MNEYIKPKEFGDYRRNDYANGEELMVEITLAEYRDLVSNKAVADDNYHKLFMESIDKDHEIESLRKQLADVTNQYTELAKWSKVPRGDFGREEVNK